MKILFDLLPIILFFAAFKVVGANDTAALEFATRWLGDGISASQAPILIATAVAILATRDRSPGSGSATARWIA